MGDTQLLCLWNARLGEATSKASKRVDSHAKMTVVNLLYEMAPSTIVLVDAEGNPEKAYRCEPRHSHKGIRAKWTTITITLTKSIGAKRDLPVLGRSPAHARRQTAPAYTRCVPYVSSLGGLSPLSSLMPHLSPKSASDPENQYEHAAA